MDGDLDQEYGDEAAGENNGDDIFEKEEGHSDVEEFMQDMEEDEMAMDGLKMPNDVDEDDSELGDGDDEEGEMEMDEYG